MELPVRLLALSIFIQGSLGCSGKGSDETTTVDGSAGGNDVSDNEDGVTPTEDTNNSKGSDGKESKDTGKDPNDKSKGDPSEACKKGVEDCTTACAAAEDKPPVCSCVSDPKSEDCGKFCKDNSKDYPDLCKDSGSGSGDDKETDAPGMEDCKKANATMKECTAGCAATANKEEVCKCTPDGRGTECIHDEKDKKKDPCLKDEIAKEYNICRTVEDIHEVIKECTTQKTSEPCQKICYDFSHKHPEDLEAVPECGCILDEVCDTICYGKDKNKYTVICSAIKDKINATYSNCLGKEANYKKCEKICIGGEGGSYKSIICECFKYNTDRSSKRCKYACKVPALKEKYQKICENVESWTDIDKACPGNDTTKKKCEDACNKVTEEKPEVCITCVKESTGEECLDFCRAQMKNYPVICEGAKGVSQKTTWIVKDASNFNPIEGATITIKQNGKEKTYTTNKDGSVVIGPYYFSSEYEVTIEHEGFEPFKKNDQSFMVNDPGQNDEPILMSKELENDKVFRVSLTWPAQPYDLDLHILMYKGATVICHSFYARQGINPSKKPGCDDGRLKMEMDNYNNLQKLTKNKPETIDVNYNVTNNMDVDFFIYVMSYFRITERQKSLAQSSAKITIYGKNPNAHTAFVPEDDPHDGEVLTSQSRFWYVGCIHGSDGFSSFKPLHELSMINPITNTTWTATLDNYRMLEEKKIDVDGLCKKAKMNNCPPNERRRLRRDITDNYDPRYDYEYKLVMKNPCTE